MVAAATLRFGQFLIELEKDGEEYVGEYAAPCGLTSKGFTRRAQTADTNVPDCDDPDAPAWTEKDIVAYSASLTGSGVVDDADYDTWEAWLASGAIKNVRVTLNTRQWVFPAVLSEFTLTGAKGQKVSYNVTIDASGAVALVPPSV